MKVLNIGSLNLDYVYRVDHITQPGETQMSLDMQTFAGGKGLNQSIALAHAGVPVCHAGLIGEGGEILLDTCKDNNIETTFIKTANGKVGHTIIQVDKNAQNCILLFGGSNQKLTKEFVDQVLSNFSKGDLLLLQNEVNMLDYIIDKAYEKQMTIVLNPSPFNSDLDACDFSKVSIFLMNEIEGEAISGSKDADDILGYMMNTYPNSKVVLTLGASGAYYCDKTQKCYQPAFPVEPVDTTAAGDTFTGYFIYGLINDVKVEKTLELASIAASIAVSRKGAVESIPYLNEVSKRISLD